MENKNLSIKLKSYNLTGQIAVVTISLMIFVALFFYIYSNAQILLESDSIDRQFLFGFVTLSILAISVPSVLLVTVGRTLVMSRSFVTLPQSSELIITERNGFTGNVRNIKTTSLEGLKNLTAIRIKTDEDGIANQYHLFVLFGDKDPVKLHTFTKYHYVLRFFYSLERESEIPFVDLCERNFETESEFRDYSRSDMT